MNPVEVTMTLNEQLIYEFVFGLLSYDKVLLYKIRITRNSTVVYTLYRVILYIIYLLISLLVIKERFGYITINFFFPGPRDTFGDLQSHTSGGP